MGKIHLLSLNSNDTLATTKIDIVFALDLKQTIYPVQSHSPHGAIIIL